MIQYQNYFKKIILAWDFSVYGLRAGTLGLNSNRYKNGRIEKKCSCIKQRTAYVKS